MKKRLLACMLAGAVLLASIGLTACADQKTEGKKQKFSEYSFDYFDTVTTIVGYEKTQAEFDAKAAQILQELEEYHKLFTIYHRYDGLENLCTINELVDGNHRTVTVDRRIVEMLLYAKDMYSKTDGIVNIAMGSVLSIWHEYRTFGIDDPSNAELPPIDRLRDAAEHTDIGCLMIDEDKNTVTITDPEMKLDVGAIAKGYAVEMIARGLEEKGIDGYVLNVGGNVRTVGSKGDGEKWTVGVEDPSGGEEYLAYLQLAGESLVTSGSYQRYYVVDGKRYHHIIDPKTLMPSEGYLAVSIVCQSSAMGDALSTALFCMSLEDGLALVNSMDGVEAMWTTENGENHQSDGFSTYVKK